MAAFETWRYEGDTMPTDDSAFTYGGTGNEFVGSSVQVTCYGGVLTVTSPAAEQVEIYSMSGSLLYNARKAPGTATCRIGGIVPRSVLVVRGSSDWIRKVIPE